MSSNFVSVYYKSAQLIYSITQLAADAVEYLKGKYYSGDLNG